MKTTKQHNAELTGSVEDYPDYIAGQADERTRIIKLISQMPELGAGVNINHPASAEQVTLRDKIIKLIG